VLAQSNSVLDVVVWSRVTWSQYWLLTRHASSRSLGNIEICLNNDTTHTYKTERKNRIRRRVFGVYTAETCIYRITPIVRLGYYFGARDVRGRFPRRKGSKGRPFSTRVWPNARRSFREARDPPYPLVRSATVLVKFPPSSFRANFPATGAECCCAVDDSAARLVGTISRARDETTTKRTLKHACVTRISIRLINNISCRRLSVSDHITLLGDYRRIHNLYIRPRWVGQQINVVFL